MEAAKDIPSPYFSHDCIHNDEVAGTASHYEEMKDFVCTKIFMFVIKNRKLQRVDDTTYGVNNASR